MFAFKLAGLPYVFVFVFVFAIAGLPDVFVFVFVFAGLPDLVVFVLVLGYLLTYSLGESLFTASLQGFNGVLDFVFF